MKRIAGLLAIAAIVTGMFFLTSCGKSEFSFISESEKLITANAANAKKGSEVMTGGLEVAEDEKIVMTSNLEKGSIYIEVYAGPSEQSIDELPAPEGDPIMTFTASGTDSISGEITADYCFVKATVTEKATGTVQIEVVPTEPEKWNTAESPDEAGEKAGVGLFMIDPSGLTLGKVTDADFRYMEGVAEAHFGVAAVELYVRKGLASIDEGDISFDQNEYKNEWTKEIDGTTITCFGNREGEATKSIWTDGDYSYAILAYGAGGDDDFGLSEEDLTSLFKNIQ